MSCELDFSALASKLPDGVELAVDGMVIGRLVTKTLSSAEKL